MIGRDLRKIARKSRTTHRQSDRPSPRPIIANKNASFFIAFQSIGYRDVKDPDNGKSLSAVRKRGPIIPNGRPVIYGGS